MRAAKKDANHNEIAAHLRSKNWCVEDCHRQSDGFPDLIAGRPGWCCLVEVKPKDGKLTPKEQKFAERWLGPRIVARSPEEAERQLEDLIRTWRR